MTATTQCRGCGDSKLTTVIDLGLQRLSDFRDDDLRGDLHPLRLVLCEFCRLAQLGDSAVAQELLYHPRYSFKSGISDAIRLDLMNVARYALNHQPTPRQWLDIASNDGTLLSFVPDTVWRCGIDPLAQFADEAAQHADLIIPDFFHPGYFRPRSMDVITSVSMFYDLDDPHRFIDGVEKVLADDGIWVIQQNYLPSMLGNNSVDNISHEHLTYWSLRPLNMLLGAYGLEVNHAELNPVNGGCFRILVSRAGTRPVDDSVRQMVETETALQEWRPFDLFARRATSNLDKLTATVEDITDRGKTVYVYGASTRGAVLWQAAGLGHPRLQKVVDRNPAKVGKKMSAIGAPIISEEQMRADPPDYLLVGPWWFRDQFIDREFAYLADGGAMIFPLPELSIVNWDTATRRLS